jgi:VWFA-related protein
MLDGPPIFVRIPSGRRASRIRSFAVGTVVAIAIPLSAQVPFRTSVDLVPIYATVRAGDGHLVRGLQAADFELIERGTPVPVAIFSDRPQPLTLALLVDMSGAGYERTKFTALREALLAFVDKLGPDDRARIGTFSGNEIALGYHFTGDRQELSRVIEEEIWMGYGLRPLWNTVAAAIESLAAEPGRRIVVVAANGPNTVSLPGWPAVKEVERAAGDPNLMVYGVSLFTSNEPRTADVPEGTTMRLTLGELAAQTGGGYIQATSSPRMFGNWKPGEDRALVSTLAGVVDELRQQYALGFAPRYHDGRVGRIEVRVKRDGMRVAARQTYRAPETGR